MSERLEMTSARMRHNERLCMAPAGFNNSAAVLLALNDVISDLEKAQPD